MFWKVSLLFTVASAFIVSISAELFEFKCKEEGRFANPQDCTSYIECVFAQDKSEFEVKNGTCPPKGGFDFKIQKCVSLKNLKDCHPRTGRMVRVHPEFDYLCEGKSGFFCGNCNTLVNCVDGSAISESCSSDHFCQHRTSFSGAAVCYPEHLSECSCQTSNEFKNDPYNDKAFFFCDAYALPTFYRCPSELIYDKYMEQCVHPEGFPPCREPGVFPLLTDCRRYYTCILSYTGWVQKGFHCPYLTMYNERNSQCEEPCRWIRDAFICTDEGRFPDKTDCQAFFECIKIDGEDDFRMMKRRCPDRFHWKKESHDTNKGYCIGVEKSTCEPLTPTTCDVPPDWCSEDNFMSFEENLFDGGLGNRHTTPQPNDNATYTSADDENVSLTVMMDKESLSMDNMHNPSLATEAATEDEKTDPDEARTISTPTFEETMGTTVGVSENEEGITVNSIIFPIPQMGDMNEISPNPHAEDENEIFISPHTEDVDEVDSIPSVKSNVRNLNRLLYHD